MSLKIKERRGISKKIPKMSLVSFLVSMYKNNDRGANKSLIIHKTSQNNRNNII
jgi:hypothetical protein